MSLKFNFGCDAQGCKKSLSEGDPFVCWNCYSEVADENEELKKTISELEDEILDLKKERP